MNFSVKLSRSDLKTVAKCTVCCVPVVTSQSHFQFNTSIHNFLNKKNTPIFSKGHHPYFVNISETPVCSPWRISGKENSVTTLLEQGSWEETPMYAKATNSLRQSSGPNGWLRWCLSRAGIANYAPRDTSHADAERDNTDLPGLSAWSPTLGIPWCLLTWSWLVRH